MSFYGNVTYYMSNAFGKMVFRNYSTLNADNRRLGIGNQKNNQINSASQLPGNKMYYDIDYSPENKYDSIIVTSGNRWLTFAKYEGDGSHGRTPLMGNNTIILYHTLPTEFIQPNPGEDGAYIGENPELILDNINYEYYPMTHLVGRNYSKQPDRTICTEERIILENEIVAGTEDEVPGYTPKIISSDWNDIIAIPQLMFDEAGHIAYGGYSYFRMPQPPEYEEHITAAEDNISAILNILFGEKNLVSDTWDGLATSLKNTYKDIGSTMTGYYGALSDDVAFNLLTRVQRLDNNMNGAYLSNESAINKLRLKLGTWGRDSNTGNLFEITSDVVTENDGRDPNSIMKQLNSVQNQQTTLNTANTAIVDRINALIAYLRNVEGSSIPDPITI